MDNVKRFIGLLMVTLATACDNVGWGGADIAIVPPPPKAAVQESGSTDDVAEVLPEGPVLFYVTPAQTGGTIVPVGEISGDTLVPLRPKKDAQVYGGRFIAENMRKGAEFTLFHNGAQVGSFVIQNSMLPQPNVCPALPRAIGTMQLNEGVTASEFLAIARTQAPNIRRQIAFDTIPNRNMQVIAPILAEKMMRARKAELPGNWLGARRQLKPVPIANNQNPGFATTFTVGDLHSVFYVAVPGATYGYDTVYVKFQNFATQGPAEARVVDVLDWNRDGQADLLLQMNGNGRNWFEAVGRDERGKWRTTFVDRCR